MVYHVFKEVINGSGARKKARYAQGGIKMKIKVMTYNIQSCRKYKDESVISAKFAGEVIKQYNPDIAGLNEVHGPGGEFGYQVKEIADYAGFPYYFFAPAIKLDGSEYGNAFISKYPIIGKENIKIPDPAVKDEDVYYETRCIAKMTVRFDKETDILATHFGLANSERENAVKTIREIIGGIKNKYILMGDFNCTPESVHINSLKEFLTDTAKMSNDSLHTFPSDKPEIKIDYIMTSADIETIKCGTIDAEASDHRPFCAEIEI